jgi:flagellar biosynthesis protein FliR
MVVFEVEVFKLFVIVLARFGGLMVSAPVLGSQNFPVIPKIGLAAMLAMIVTPLLPSLGEPLPDSVIALSMIAASELLIGLMIGFVMTIFFAALQVAGQLIDMLSGFALMNVFNPALQTQVPVFGFFLYLIAVLYLFVLNLHHVILRALVVSFDRIPPGGFVLNPELLGQVTMWGTSMFTIGLVIAAPIAGALLIAYATMGLLSRLVPQIHIFVVGFPLTIAMALGLMALMIGVYLDILDVVFEDMFRNVDTAIRGMA